MKRNVVGMFGAVDKKHRRPARAVRDDVLRLLSTVDDSKELLTEMEVLAKETTFGGLTPVWGPALYARARLIFRSFILRHFATFAMEPNWKVREISWNGEHQKPLQEWLDASDSVQDVQIFRRLLAWKLQQWPPKTANQRWQKELVERFQKSGTRAARQAELEKLDLSYWMDEETALILYRQDPSVSAPFILRHLPRYYGLLQGEKRKLWSKLFKVAQENNDADFQFRLYRDQVPIKQWTAEALALCTSINQADKLLVELEKRHPNTWQADLGETYRQLLEVKGTDIFPYIMPKLGRVSRGLFGGSYGKLLSLALERGWLELWAGLLRTRGRPREYNQAVQNSLELSDSQAKQRLLLLSGIRSEWNFAGMGLATYVPLEDDTADALYRRFPELLRGPFKAQITPNHQQLYPKLLETLKKADDTPLIDYIAARIVTNDGRWGQEKLLRLADELTDYYSRLQSDSTHFAERAAAVLGQVPPYVLWNYHEVIRKNKLARLFYERRPESYLASESAVVELLEASEIHAQTLAFRVLALPDPQSQKLAQTHLRHLLAGLLRPLHRETRSHCFQALLNACRDLETAEMVLAKAREANTLPDKRYPKEELIGLVGAILHRFPSLQADTEREVVYQARRRY